jgi:hypothetical protein
LSPRKQTFHADHSKGKVVIEVFFKSQIFFTMISFLISVMSKRACTGAFFTICKNLPIVNNLILGSVKRMQVLVSRRGEIGYNSCNEKGCRRWPVSSKVHHDER